MWELWLSASQQYLCALWKFERIRVAKKGVTEEWCLMFQDNQFLGAWGYEMAQIPQLFC